MVLAIGFAQQTCELETPPNIVFIFVDDQGYYDLGCHGATEIKTPRIDAMAKQGTRFTDYYAAAPICSPSRAGLLTGCYPRRVGNHIWVHRADSRTGIHSDELTIAELFKENGYAPHASANGISDFMIRACHVTRVSITILDCCTISTRLRSSTSRTRAVCRQCGSLELYNLSEDSAESKLVRNQDVIRKLRGMAILFQDEMRLDARPAGQAPPQPRADGKTVVPQPTLDKLDTKLDVT